MTYKLSFFDGQPLTQEQMVDLRLDRLERAVNRLAEWIAQRDNWQPDIDAEIRNIIEGKQ